MRSDPTCARLSIPPSPPLQSSTSKWDQTRVLLPGRRSHAPRRHQNASRILGEEEPARLGVIPDEERRETRGARGRQERRAGGGPGAGGLPVPPSGWRSPGVQRRSGQGGVEPARRVCAGGGGRAERAAAGRGAGRRPPPLLPACARRGFKRAPQPRVTGQHAAARAARGGRQAGPSVPGETRAEPRARLSPRAALQPQVRAEPGPRAPVPLADADGAGARGQEALLPRRRASETRHEAAQETQTEPEAELRGRGHHVSGSGSADQEGESGAEEAAGEAARDSAPRGVHLSALQGGVPGPVLPGPAQVLPHSARGVPLPRVRQSLQLPRKPGLPPALAQAPPGEQPGGDREPGAEGGPDCGSAGPAV